VLVTTQNEKHTPKIIDFGVAKATSQRLTGRTVFTELGQLITPGTGTSIDATLRGWDHFTGRSPGSRLWPRSRLAPWAQ
jgi:hypothetical protein